MKLTIHIASSPAKVIVFFSCGEILISSEAALKKNITVAIIVFLAGFPGLVNSKDNKNFSITFQ